MPPLRLIAAATLVTTASVALTAAPAHAGGGIFVPPARIDVGSAMSGTQDTAGLQLVAGIHWASLYPGPTPIDVGVGIVSASFGSAGDDGMARAAPVDELQLVGGYAELAVRHGGARWWRGWLGARVEVGEAELNGRTSDYVGVATRCTVELFSGGGAGGNNALVIGVGAVGVYAELSARRLSESTVDVGASVGLSLRVPLIVGGT